VTGQSYRIDDWSGADLTNFSPLSGSNSDPRVKVSCSHLRKFNSLLLTSSSAGALRFQNHWIVEDIWTLRNKRQTSRSAVIPRPHLLVNRPSVTIFKLLRIWVRTQIRQYTAHLMITYSLCPAALQLCENSSWAICHLSTSLAPARHISVGSTPGI